MKVDTLLEKIAVKTAAFSTTFSVHVCYVTWIIKNMGLKFIFPVTHTCYIDDSNARRVDEVGAHCYDDAIFHGHVCFVSRLPSPVDHKKLKNCILLLIVSAIGSTPRSNTIRLTSSSIDTERVRVLSKV